jgi:hypothetical protein
MTLNASFPTAGHFPLSPTTPVSPRARRRHWSAEQKTELLARFASSGQTAAAFCRATGLSEATFSHWCRRQARATSEPPGRFAAVRLGEAPPGLAAGAVRVHCPGGIDVTFAIGTDPHWLGQLVAALR